MEASLREMFSLSGKVALVTGASRGLGWGMAQGLAQAGAHVVLNGRNAELLDQRAGELKERGLAATAAAFDVSRLEDIPRHFERIVDAQGRLDILVSNAGFPFRKPFLEMGIDDWRHVMQTDLDASFVLAREAAQLMTAQGGVILLVSSILGSIGRPSVQAYCAAKGGLDAMMRSIAAELGPKGIRCNTIAPGYFETDATRLLRDNREFYEMVTGRIPARRWGNPKELGGVVVFLASDASSYINGAVITVDGGLTAVL